MKKIYIVFLLFLFFFVLSSCKKDDVFIPEEIAAEHQFYDENFYNYIRYINFPYFEKTKTTFKQSLTTYMGIKTGTNRSIDYYQFDYSHSYKETYFNVEPTVLDGGIVRRFSHEFLPESIIKSKINSIYGKIVYSHTIDLITETKTYLFKESFFTTELINSSFSNSNQNDAVLFSFLNNSIKTEPFYRFKINAIVPKNSTPYHLDFQTYIKTTSNDIYPFMGIYNYNLINEDYISISDLKVDKQIDIEEILIYAEYNNGKDIEVIKQIIPDVLD